jgi:hypothetical protein
MCVCVCVCVLLHVLCITAVLNPWPADVFCVAQALLMSSVFCCNYNCEPLFSLVRNINHKVGHVLLVNTWRDACKLEQKQIIYDLKLSQQIIKKQINEAKHTLMTDSVKEIIE